MGDRAQYRRRDGTEVVAVRLDLDTDGFTYRKWGGEQSCKRGDWLVNNDGDVYTVDADTFARSYAPVTRGVYRKTTPVWAERASTDGAIRTKEGITHYRAGDWLVFNDARGDDGYAVEADAFDRLYARADGEGA